MYINCVYIQPVWVPLCNSSFWCNHLMAEDVKLISRKCWENIGLKNVNNIKIFMLKNFVMK